MSAVEDIFWNARGYCENIKPSKKYFEQLEKCADLSEKLGEGLNDEQMNLLRELSIEHGGWESESNLTHFEEGFKLGLTLAAESFLNK